jgi:hypothetical protein
MEEVSDYRRKAIRCRQLASQIGGWEKKYLTDLAAEWERLASEAEARAASWRSAKRDKSEPS